MKKLLCLMTALMLTACGSNVITYVKTETTGLKIGVDAATQTPNIIIGQSGSDYARVPVVTGKKEGEKALTGFRKQWEDGEPTVEIKDALSVCGSFGGTVGADTQGGNMKIDKMFATGSAAQAVCDGLAGMYETSED